MSDLSDFIDQVEICNTHEHQKRQDESLAEKPDVLSLLFDNYFAPDLRIAGTPGERLAAK